MEEVKDQEQIEQYLQAYQIKHIFNEPLLPHLSLHRFKQGEYICTQGESSPYVFILVKGKVKVFTTSAEGKALIISFKKPLEVLGEIEYFRGIDFLNTVEVISPVLAIGIHYRWLNKYGRDHAPLLQFLLDIITQKYCVKSNSLSFNLMHPVEVRLASYVLSVTSDEADAPYEGQVGAVNLKDAANLIGTSYRHLNRVIKQFCAEGLIERANGGILVKDREGLRTLAGNNIYE
ncbi:cyclic nucleotide-binding domain-containing protein [Paenibacillus sp. SC116]|uniref:Crp/Fnr family transcriptional regulator n=1 Tax=Paenibacillus sp. SC116 TaxID=2968986 RepID=UPI00215AB472|nr:cyclic nucleotide-binding domain-containing protein [Paenibacillus sp. SC116]MCR8842277.1 cyclic nucleotide-binding domain-containing protein [Paenibacillus sp. SC116]